MSDYLKNQNIDPNSLKGRPSWPRPAPLSVVVAVPPQHWKASFYSCQLNEVKLISDELAAKYAADHSGISESEAETILQGAVPPIHGPINPHSCDGLNPEGGAVDKM